MKQENVTLFFATKDFFVMKAYTKAFFLVVC